MKSKKLILWPALLAYLVIAWRWPLLGLAALVCMLAPVVVAIFRGRLWCGQYCPRGHFYNLFADRRALKPPAWLTSKTTRIIILVAIMSIFAVRVALVWPDFSLVGQIFWQMVLVTTVVGAWLAYRFTSRTWCMICPMGTLSSLVSPQGTSAVTLTGRCVNCKKCTNACPMHIDVARYVSKGYAVDDPDCIKCEQCVAACPLNSLALGTSGTVPVRNLSVND